MDKRYESNRIVREKICQATLALMRVKPFSRITVSDIVREAGVARVSYYRNFHSKEDVIRSYLEKVVNELFQSHNVPEQLDSYDAILSAWQYIGKQKELFSAFCSGDLLPLLVNFLMQLNLPTGTFSAKPGDEYYFAGYFGAFYNILRKWMIGGCRETPEEMAGFFYRLWNGRISDAGRP